MKRILPLTAICLLSLNGLYGADDIQLGANKNLFMVLAAINAAGYDEGLSLPDNNPLRLQLREYLSKQTIEVLPELKKYYRRHMQKNGVQDLSEYISYALSVTGPPSFAWSTRDVEIPPDALALTEFTPLLIDFYRQAKLGGPVTESAYEMYSERSCTPFFSMCLW